MTFIDDDDDEIIRHPVDILMVSNNKKDMTDANADTDDDMKVSAEAGTIPDWRHRRSPFKTPPIYNQWVLAIKDPSNSHCNTWDDDWDSNWLQLFDGCFVKMEGTPLPEFTTYDPETTKFLHKFDPVPKPNDMVMLRLHDGTYKRSGK